MHKNPVTVLFLLAAYLLMLVHNLVPHRHPIAPPVLVSHQAHGHSHHHSYSTPAPHHHHQHQESGNKTSLPKQESAAVPNHNHALGSNPELKDFAQVVLLRTGENQLATSNSALFPIPELIPFYPVIKPKPPANSNLFESLLPQSQSLRGPPVS